MRLIKLAFISFVVFFLLITGISLFFPSHVRISRAADLRMSRDSVMWLIRNPANWKKWYPGADTLAVYEADAVVKGLRMPGGKLLLITSFTDSTVTAANSTAADEKATMGWTVMEMGQQQVTVQWYMDFYLNWYPWEKFSGLLLEKRFGPHMEQGLATLRKL